MRLLHDIVLKLKEANFKHWYLVVLLGSHFLSQFFLSCVSSSLCNLSIICHIFSYFWTKLLLVSSSSTIRLAFWGEGGLEDSLLHKQVNQLVQYKILKHPQMCITSPFWEKDDGRLSLLNQVNQEWSKTPKRPNLQKMLQVKNVKNLITHSKGTHKT